MTRSNQDILEILKRVNGLPVEDVKEEIDSLKMSFSEWSNLTNQRFAGYNERDCKRYELSMLQDKVDISYEEFLQVSRLCKRFIHRTGLSDRAKDERARSEMINEGFAKEEELGGKPFSEEDLQILDEIAYQWDDVRAKYDPAKEVERISQHIQGFLRYDASVSSEYQAYIIEEMKRSEELLKKCFGYIDDTREKNDATMSIESELLSAMQDGRKAFETLQQFQGSEISEFYRFMEENGVSQVDIEQFYKKRFTGMQPSSRAFIMAREGKGFRLNDSGELEVVDEQTAKDLIARDFFPTSSVAQTSITQLEQGRKYIELTNSLPIKNPDRLTVKEINELMQFDQIDLKYWMVDNPSKINQALTALRLRGQNIDWTEIQDELIDELENPKGYFEDEMEEEYYKSKVEQALSAMGYDVTARDEDFQGENYGESEDYVEQEDVPQPDDLSSLSVEELMQRINSNNITIANNEQAIKQALIQKILGQQQQIAEQTAEIDRLKSQKEL